LTAFVWIFLLLVLGIFLLPHATGPATPSDPTATPPLTSFEFRGLKPGITTVFEAKKRNVVKECGHVMAEVACKFSKDTLGDIFVSSYNTFISFKGNKFEDMLIKFDTGNTDRVRDFVTQAYGAPCRSNTVELENAFGAKVTSQEDVWCFKEGVLTLSQHSEGQNMWSQGNLDFSTAQPETPIPTVDRNSL
jgi:hypothetical protein